jgi:hypothetical protein
MKVHLIFWLLLISTLAIGFQHQDSQALNSGIITSFSHKYIIKQRQVILDKLFQSVVLAQTQNQQAVMRDTEMQYLSPLQALLNVKIRN